MRVAIIGSGPAGFYAAEALLKRAAAAVDVDMFDRRARPPEDQDGHPRFREHGGAADIPVPRQRAPRA